MVHSKGYACGEANGKNGFGAYGGFRRFYVEVGSAHIEGQRAEFPELEEILGFKEEKWREICEEAVAKAIAKELH